MLKNISLRSKLRLIEVLALTALLVIGISAIQAKRASMMEGVRQQLRDQMSIVFTMLDHYRLQADTGQMPLASAQAQALAQLRQIRYQDKEFFSVGTMEPVMLMHPAIPALEGKNFGALKDKNGKPFIAEMTAKVRAEGSAYVEYWWPKAGEDTPSPKLSHARRYDKWDWLVNTGMYIDNINQQFYRDTAWFIVVLLGVAALVSMLSGMLGRSITDALQEVLGRMRTVETSGDLTQHFDSTRRDEFGELGRGFESLLAARRKAEAELRDHRDHLQQTVLDRTHDLLIAKNAAEQANVAKTLFVSNMSHELRTPMHAILSFARLGEEKTRKSRDAHAEAAPEFERLLAYFQRISTSGDRLLNLLNDLLDIAKLESGRMDLRLQKVLLEECVQQALQEFDAQLQSNAIVVDLQVPAHATPLVADAFRIGQVIRNLLSNAIKFSPRGSQITISFAPSTTPDSATPMFEMRIADEGVGIPEEELELVFEKFVQSSNTRSMAGGTGLGLPICREIIEAHRGRVFAQNRQPCGTEFVIQLPLTNEAALPVTQAG